MTLDQPPQASVIIPTYNSSEPLARALESLAGQNFPVGRFEVVVADDGSRDSTVDVVDSFRDRLRLKYYFQEDQGFRLAAVRNGGARLSSGAVLIFLDSGTVAGPDFVRAHIRHHSERRNAVIGYAYGYQPWSSGTELSQALSTLSPERVVEQFSNEPWIWDWRHKMMVDSGRDVNERTAPWLLFQGMNCSVRSSDFWDVGGFDEKICHWGTEDLELGFRLWRAGIPFAVGCDSWAMELPGPRDMKSRLQDVKANGWFFLEKYHEPVAELFWLALLNEGLWEVEADYETVLQWTKKARHIDVRSEIDELTKDFHDAGSHRIAVFGCGSDLPPSLSSCTLVDFDRELLEKVAPDGRREVHHAIGLRTPLPDQSHDMVVITSRLSGLWERWHKHLTAEAHRIGRQVRSALEIM